MRKLIAALAVCVATQATAEMPDLRAIVDDYVLPGYEALATDSATLAAVAEKECAPDSPALRAAYHDAFDSWVKVSHMRFGPSEQGDRAFALAFWPDSRGATPKALATLIRDADPVVETADGFATVSVAARGFYALEFLLYDPDLGVADASGYHCALVRAVTKDIARNASAILGGWRDGYADLMAEPGNDTYRSETEAAQQLFTALSAGLEFDADTRLGRPMGTFERPRPNRAEAHRSGRSLRHVILSLESMRRLAALLSGGDPALDADFDRTISRARDLDDPVFAGVSDPQGRFRVETLQQEIRSIRQRLAEELGPRLGIAAGFNSLDGD